ncbi:TetR/AcrR family transcriptional regulator [Bordetella genomosp. 1]|uniref:TetR family transcriptional regulator n=1 Tax=Bordetella genomosp. 1 TaxID=1395607 RepID=A0ABX4F276_9BORD|nr:TetR/AcrR family transcriptional regulator [Bordetella genomosp. 1]OZI65754.1 TetR family transcriptional regulator [Bordetella genomosp. 1]
MAGVRQFDEDAVLDKALVVFWQRGYADATMQELAAATGVQRGSLYNAYGDKETLFLRVFDRYRNRFLGEARRALAHPDLRSALTGFFDYLIASMTLGTPRRGCLSTKTALGGGNCIDPAIRKTLAGLIDEQEQMFRDRIAAADPAELGHVPPAQAAQVLITFMRGLVVIERIYQDTDRLRESVQSLLDALLAPRADAARAAA